MKRTLLAVLLVCLGCSSATDAEDVGWSKYPDGTQERIDSGTCAENQALFDAFDDMDAAVRKREGSGTGDVLGYIDTKMEDAGCYE